MIAATYTQGDKLEITEVAAPTIRDGEALLKVEATSICGTDTKIARAGHRKLKPGQRIVLGHEFVGTIVEGAGLGKRVGVAPNWGCGQCEACIRGMTNMCPEFSAFGINTDGSHASYVRIPAPAVAQGNMVDVPEGVPWAEAALAEPLSCCLNGQKAARLAPGETVLIYGAGPMGLLHVLLALACGAARVILADPNFLRLQQAGRIADIIPIRSDTQSVPDEVKRITGGAGVDVAIVAAPVRALAEEALALLVPFGRLCLFAGLPKDDAHIRLDGNLIHYGNLGVVGTSGGCTADYGTAMRLISGRRVDVRPVISHTFPLSRMSEAYDVALSGKCMKIVITGEG
jgi:L-iditol 2-dehydrogenase